MKKIVALVILISTTITSFAQKDTLVQYFDYNLKICLAEDATYYRVALKTDKGWQVNDFYAYEQKLQMEGTYADDSMKISEGSFSYYYVNGKLKESGTYVHGKRTGFWMGFHENGKPEYTGNYSDGMPIGIHKHYYDTKELSYQGEFDNKGSGKGRETYYFENGSISSIGIKCEGNMEDSIWVYYYRNGAISYIEYFDNGKITDSACFDEKGVVLKNKCSRIVIAKADYDVYRYLGDNLKFPEGYNIHSVLKTYVRFVVNEDGSIAGVTIMKHVHPAFDKATMNVVTKMPAWKPAKDHNRPHKFYFTLPIVFKQD